MKKFLGLILAAVLMVLTLASCASGIGDPNAMDDYAPEVDYLITDKGTFYFEEAEGETAILTKYNGKATKDDHVEIPAVFNDRVVTTIGDEAFYNLASVTEVTIPDSIIKIGKHAFAGCTALTAINLPAGVVEIDDMAFARCTALTTVNDSAHPLTALTAIGDKVFWECTSLVTFNGGSLPATLTTIGEGAFWKCEALTSVEIPASVTEIGALAYYGCIGLESIKLHDGLTKLGDFIFTTETSTLKDKIDLSNITEDSYVWKYVENIAEPAEEETAAETDAPQE